MAQVWRLKEESNNRTTELIQDMDQLFANSKKLKFRLDENTEQLEKALEIQLKTDPPDVAKETRHLKDELSKIIDLLGKHESKQKHFEREIEVVRLQAVDEPKFARLLQPTQTEQEEMANQLTYLAKEVTNIRMKMPKAEAAALMQRETDEKIDELEAKMERKVETLK